jgi:deoxyribodipyrimidine photolyase
MAAKRTHNTIHWFRKGLRLHDNPSLKEAFESSLTVRPIYVLDAEDVKHGNIGFVRWRFILQSLEDLDKRLRKLNSRYVLMREIENTMVKGYYSIVNHNLFVCRILWKILFYDMHLSMLKMLSLWGGGVQAYGGSLTFSRNFLSNGLPRSWKIFAPREPN